MHHPKLNTGQSLYRQARCRIPGGTQLLSKRPEMFLPERWPVYYQRAQGAEVWDLDGNRYLDMSLNGVGSCILGHADPEVNSAVIRAVECGSMSTLNAPEEVELAERLCELHPWADMARFMRSGGEAMAAAVRIARAATGRDRIAFCGYHGWHDWYLAANLSGDSLAPHLLAGLDSTGVPRGLEGSMLPFHYNQAEELQQIASIYPGEIAAIVMEPTRSKTPAAGFLEDVRHIADRIGAVLIFDEATVGFRLATGGAHLIYGVEPDMAVFAKAISNGFAMAAVIGREAVMQAAQNSFISSTYWTERIGPAAALATIAKHERERVPVHLARIGARVQQGWKVTADRAGLPVQISGMDPLSLIRFDVEDAQAVRTLFTQEMLDRGFLAGSAFYVTYSHTDAHIDNYLEAVEPVFALLASAVTDGTVRAHLHGPVAHSGFQRLA